MEECCEASNSSTGLSPTTYESRGVPHRGERRGAVRRVQSELDIKLQENETASETRLTDAASVVRWWQTRVRVARTRARLLPEPTSGRPPAHKRHTREQLILGLSVHFGAIDGVSQEGCSTPRSSSARVTAAHARWLSKVASANPAAVVPQLPDVKGVFPRRIRAEDAWRVMRGFCLRRFHYCPGDVVQVRGTDMEWYPSVVTYSRSYADGIESERVAALEDHPRARAEMMVNVVRPNGMIEFKGTRRTRCARTRPACACSSAARRGCGSSTRCCTPRRWRGSSPTTTTTSTRSRGWRTAAIASPRGSTARRGPTASTTPSGRGAPRCACRRPCTRGPLLSFEFASVSEKRSRIGNRAFGDYFHAFDDEPGVQEALLAWVLEPFAALDMITGGEEDDGWDFDEEPLSYYTYVSVVGGGYLVAMITAFVQITLPITLFYGVIHQEILENFESVPGLRGPAAPTTAADPLRRAHVHHDDRAVADRALHEQGRERGQRHLELNSLRQVITDKNEDTYGQKWGFKLDIFCNTAYVGILYTMNIFLVFFSARRDRHRAERHRRRVHRDARRGRRAAMGRGQARDPRGRVQAVLRRYLRLHELRQAQGQHPARPAAPEMKRGSSGDHTRAAARSIDHAAQGLDVTLHQDSLRRTLKQSRRRSASRRSTPSPTQAHGEEAVRVRHPHRAPPAAGRGPVRAARRVHRRHQLG